MKRNLLFIVCVLLMLPLYSQTDTLRVDFDRTGNSNPETGWEIMEFADKAIPSSDFTGFTAMGTTLKARVLMLDEATADANSTRSIFRNNSNYSDENSDLLSDWIAADVMGGASRTIAVQITGIPAGTYTWKSYHHDFSDQVGRFQAKVENKAGVISDYDSIYQISLSDPNQLTHVGYTNTFLNVAKYFNDVVVSAGPTDTITVHFTHEYPLGDASIDHPNKLLIINGFELYETPAVLPEVIHISPKSLTFNGAYTKEIYITGENLTEDITISTLENCTVLPETLAADAAGDTVKVTFDGTTSVDDYIYFASGEGKDSIKISATEYVKDTLKVDFNKAGVTTTEDGWNIIGLSDKQIPTSEYSAINALNSEVKVHPVFLNNPIAESTRAVDRNKSANYSDTLFEVLDDYIAADAITGDIANGDHCNTLAIKLTGIPAGNYIWKSYHHDTDDQYGKFSTKIESTEGYLLEDDSLYRTSQSRTTVEGYTDSFEGVMKVMENIVSAGADDTITVSFISEFEFDADTMNTNQSIKFVLINGFELTMASSIAALSQLAVTGGNISPNFEEDIFIYDIELPVGTTVEAISDVVAYEAVEGGTAILNTPESLPGEGSIEVTAPDGITKNTYTLNLTVLLSDDANLSNITVDAGTLTPSFDAAITEYTVEAPADAVNVNVSATKNDPAATVTGDGAIDVTSGGGVATILVKAADGTEKTYTVTISLQSNSVLINELNTISVYPTVSTTTFNIKAKEGSKVEVFDISGALTLTKTITSDTEVISVNQEGLYLIKVKEEGQVSIFKVVKK